MKKSAQNLRESAAILSGVRAVAFDGYGTLFDFTEPDFIATMAEIAGEQGLDADASEMWQRFLRASKALRVEHHRDPVYIRYHEAWRLQFERVFKQMRLVGDAVAAADHFRERLADAPAFEESGPVIEALRSKRYEVALLSNADDDFLTACLRRNKLEFGVVITSESARAIKPNREIFDMLAGALQTPPGEILYAGDNPIPDVLGPVRAGMLAAWVNRGGYRKPRNVPEPQVRVKTLTELLGLLRGNEATAPTSHPTPNEKIELGDTPRPPALRLRLRPRSGQAPELRPSALPAFQRVTQDSGSGGDGRGFEEPGNGVTAGGKRRRRGDKAGAAETAGGKSRLRGDGDKAGRAATEAGKPRLREGNSLGEGTVVGNGRGEASLE